jgi:hypothetical protein
MALSGTGKSISTMRVIFTRPAYLAPEGGALEKSSPGSARNQSLRHERAGPLASPRM